MRKTIRVPYIRNTELNNCRVFEYIRRQFESVQLQNGSLMRRSW